MLAFEIRRVGDVSVVRCSGRMIEGPDSAALFRVVEDLLARTKCVVLNLAGVQTIDSGGLGLLLRVVMRTRTAGGRINLCALPPKVAEVIRITRLQAVFDVHAIEEDAIVALHQPTKAADGSFRFVYANVLCVAPSADMVSYTSEVLTQAGYDVVTAGNVVDAVTLLQMIRPKLVITAPEFRAARDTPAGQTFNRLLDAAWVMELPPDLSRVDAGESARALVAGVFNAIGGPDASTRPAGRRHA